MCPHHPSYIDELTWPSFKWVESPSHGGGGPDWVENHIEAVVAVAGTHLVRIMLHPALSFMTKPINIIY